MTGAWLEVFKLAPGKHEDFMRSIARADEVARSTLPISSPYRHGSGSIGTLRNVLVANDHSIVLRLSTENIDGRNSWYSAVGGYLRQGQPHTVKVPATLQY